MGDIPKDSMSSKYVKNSKSYDHSHDDSFDLLCYLEELEGFHGDNDLRNACVAVKKAEDVKPTSDEKQEEPKH